MLKTIIRIISYVLLLILPSSCFNTCYVKAGTASSIKKYSLTEDYYPQPVDHNKNNGSVFDQRIFILFPKEASVTSPVFFILGGETNFTKARLLSAYNAYGRPDNVIFIAAEHRGYGKSVTFDKDQTTPSYVSVEQALADYHNIVAFFEKKYTGPWMAAGYSYGGGLAINFAFEYPNDVRVVLSSSGAVDYPFMTDYWDRKLRKYYGEQFYNRLAENINYFKPRSLFDKNWVDREFLSGACAVIPQKQYYQKYKLLLGLISYLPPQTFLKIITWLDAKLNSGKGLMAVQSETKKTLSREEAITARFSRRVWLYQQCTETGFFMTSEKKNGIFPSLSRQEIHEEYQTLFGKNLRFASKKQWSPRKMLKKLTVPLIYVNGGKDPTAGMLEADHNIDNGRYISIPNGRHCPDLSNPKIGQEVLSMMLKYLKKN
jgi:pimeloyl-ACP methyl ester carboxylesterase